MVITISAYVMMAIFMYVIMKKKMSPFTALVLIPLVFAIIFSCYRSSPRRLTSVH